MSFPKILLIDNLYDNPLGIAAAIKGLDFQPVKFGEQVLNFNMINDDLIVAFRKILNDPCLEFDRNNSGIFRKPIHFIHFEDFKTELDWCFTVALEPTKFQLYRHEASGSESVLEGPRLNTIDFMQWDGDKITSIHLEPNQCVLFRPWLYHTFDGGLTQHYVMNHVSPLVEQ